MIQRLISKVDSLCKCRVFLGACHNYIQSDDKEFIPFTNDARSFRVTESIHIVVMLHSGIG